MGFLFTTCASKKLCSATYQSTTEKLEMWCGGEN
jgi:hypothetical protein